MARHGQWSPGATPRWLRTWPGNWRAHPRPIFWVCSARAPVQHHVGGMPAVHVPFNGRLAQPPGHGGGAAGGTARCARQGQGEAGSGAGSVLLRSPRARAACRSRGGALQRRSLAGLAGVTRAGGRRPCPVHILSALLSGEWGGPLRDGRHSPPHPRCRPASRRGLTHAALPRGRLDGAAGGSRGNSVHSRVGGCGGGKRVRK